MSFFTKNMRDSSLRKAIINTPLGPMIAVGSDEALYVLDFEDGRSATKVAKLGEPIILGNTTSLTKIKNELDLYFAGKLKNFTTPIRLGGTEFQQKAWQALTQIPYGCTRSYLEQAVFVGNNKAFRAVANANGANLLSIIIPCHRVIQSSGAMGGYGGGCARKEWLLQHEKKYG